MKKVKIRQGDVLFWTAFVFLAGFVLGMNFVQQPIHTRSVAGEKVVEMIIPAVDSEGTGVAAKLYTTVKPGTGKILLDTSSVLNYLDTQLSGRIAAKAAADYAKVNINSIDVIYTLEVNASIVEGPSAGASMALSVLLAIENKTADGIAMTGTISPDGTIGSVGAVAEKARTAKNYGSRVFLVPKGQLESEESRRVKTCSFLGSVQVCKIYYQTETVDLSRALNMTVYEVGNIAEAYSYFNKTAGKSI